MPDPTKNRKRFPSLSSKMYGQDIPSAEKEKLQKQNSSSWFSEDKKVPRPIKRLILVVILGSLLYSFNKRQSSSELAKIAQEQFSGKKQYGIMFDAGSTGSRIHVYRFHKDNSGSLILEDELFEQIKPGLSSYPDDIKGATSSIKSLLDKAEKYIPADQLKETPVALKASAGLRILGKEKSEPILKAVQKLLTDSPFHQVWVPEIMGGDKEAVYSWVTLNYLAKVLGKKDKTLADTYGTLDLGGGSTQIAFHPKDSETKKTAPDSYTVTESAFGENFEVYIHSYLGLGLMSARQLVLGGAHEGNSAKVASHPCFSKSFSQTWENARSTYEITGSENSSSENGHNFENCYNLAKTEITKMSLHKPKEIQTNKLQQFYAFSYYFDRANEMGLIKDDGGDVTVGEFKKAAEKACDGNDRTVPKNTENSDWLCMDLSIISSLLIDGFGFDEGHG